MGGNSSYILTSGTGWVLVMLILSGTRGVGGGVNPLTFLQPSQFCFWFIRKQGMDICHRFDFSYVSFV